MLKKNPSWCQIVTITNGDKPSTLGSTDWHDGQASSLSEMIVSIAEQVGGADVLDETNCYGATYRYSFGYREV